MPVNYQNGKIYAIRSYSTDNIYVGSTCQPLSKRLYEHRSKYNSYKKTGKGVHYSSFEILQYDDHYIELIKNYPCECKAKLVKKEGKYIRKYIKKGRCVNYRIDGRNIKQWRQDNKEKLKLKRKQYRENNRERFKEERKQYRENNREKIREYAKRYEDNNKERLTEYRKQYFQRNKDKIKQKTAVKITCDCGAICLKSYLKMHKRTIKHKKWEENNK